MKTPDELLKEFKKIDENSSKQTISKDKETLISFHIGSSTIHFYKSGDILTAQLTLELDGILTRSLNVQKNKNSYFKYEIDEQYKPEYIMSWYS